MNECVASDELDRIIRPWLGARYIGATAFYAVRVSGTGAQSLGHAVVKKVRAHGYVMLPLHTRHHWAYAFVQELDTADGPTINVSVFDSAPSHCTKRDFLRVLRQVFERFQHSISVETAYQQRRNTNECGLHLILSAAMQDQSSRQPALPTVRPRPPFVDLEWMRNLFQSPRAKLDKQTTSDIRGRFGITGGGGEVREGTDDNVISKPENWAEVQKVSDARGGFLLLDKGTWKFADLVTVKKLRALVHVHFTDGDGDDATEKGWWTVGEVEAVAPLTCVGKLKVTRDSLVDIISDRADAQGNLQLLHKSSGTWVPASLIKGKQTLVEVAGEKLTMDLVQARFTGAKAHDAVEPEYVIPAALQEEYQRWRCEDAKDKAPLHTTTVDGFIRMMRKAEPTSIFITTDEMATIVRAEKDLRSAQHPEQARSRWTRLLKKIVPVEANKMYAVAYHHQHYFALRSEGPVVQVLDSMEGYQSTSRSQIAQAFAEAVKVWRNAAQPAWRLAETEQQEAGSNDCGLYSLSNIWGIKLTRSNIANNVLPTKGIAPEACTSEVALPIPLRCDAIATGQGKNRRCGLMAMTGSTKCALHGLRRGAKKCTARTRKGALCTAWASEGADVCPMHAAMTETVKKAKPVPQVRTPWELPLGTAAPLSLESDAAGFRPGERTVLPLARLTVHDLGQLTQASLQVGTQWSQAALHPNTRAQHLKWLKLIGTEAEAATVPREWPAVDFIVRVLQQYMATRKIKATSMSTMMASVAGALKHLPLYLPKMPYGFDLVTSPEWRQASRYMGIKAVAEAPNQALPISRSQVLQACERADPETAALIAISWITTGRPGDVSQLTMSDICETERLAVTFRRGKAVKLRRAPFTVHTAMGEFSKFIRPVLDKAASAQRPAFLFPCSNPAARRDLLTRLTSTLRLIDTRLESRSIRRGALQAMARKGVERRTIMNFSGHSNETTLEIYLGQGILDTEQRTRQQKAISGTLLSEGPQEITLSTV